MYMSFTREQASEVILRRIALITCAALVVIYAYLASASVFHAITERSMGNMIDEKRTGLARLEQEYFLLSKHITPDSASFLGLTKVRDKYFVSRERRVAAGEF